MEVYILILRHGIAEERRTGRTDSARRLTGAGKVKLRQVLEIARAAGVKPSLILTSPYVRAAETAELAAEILGCADPIVQTDALLPSSPPRAVWRLIREHAGKTAILLAGHEPLLSETASFLLGASWALMDLKKGALLRIDLDRLDEEPRGVLQWLLTAKLAAGRTTQAGE
jgi:phosphohistidine phosphatase